MFSPKTDYQVTYKPIRIIAFENYSDRYVIRPPYQRKNVWPRTRSESLMDSLLRRYYVPRLVLREVHVNGDTMRYEVIDGQQRILTVQSFFRDQLRLPDTLKEVDPALPGKRYSQLPVEVREFIGEEIQFDVDVVHGIENPFSPDHQALAAQIFWRLQQGVSLNFMERAHSRLSSLARNFVVKYADDISFDYDQYEPLDENPYLHSFFSLLNRTNDRMQHLMIMIRLLMMEYEDGPTDIRETHVTEFVDSWQRADGIGNLAMESEPQAKSLLGHLDEFYEIFRNDPMHLDESPVAELDTEYLILSLVMLLRHLRNHYVFTSEHRPLFHEFVQDFCGRWRNSSNSEPEVIEFSNNRQQGKASVEVRDLILRLLFFRFAQQQGVALQVKDDKRSYSEAERITIYRRDRGLCQMCLKEGRTEKEATVPWSQYEADHVLPHSRGGQTEMDNAQVLCRMHNRSKGATTR